MNMSTYRATFGVMFALAMLSLASPSSAQQKTPPAPQQPPALSQSQPPAFSAQAAPPAQAPAPSVAAQPAATPAASDATATPADGSRSLKSTTVALRELSPWSMFVSADILVKAVMIG
ncbi:MAG: tonB-system energizer ExbB, partial [Betaproteobacteria bacterium]